MAQVNTSNLNDTPRLYKRGNAEIDLDAYLNDADAGFVDWLNNLNFNDKKKLAVANAFRDLYTEIDSGRMSARIGGGFTGSNPKYINAEKGFDAYGYAAGYLGSVLRKLQNYKQPQSSTESSKRGIDYSMPSEWADSMMGNNLQAWLNLDNIREDGSRDTIGRATQLASNLSEYRNFAANKQQFKSEEERTKHLNFLDQCIKDLEDGVLENEWYNLSLLGLKNIDKFFSTSGTAETLEESESEEPSRIKPDYPLFQAWLNENYPKYNGDLGNLNLSESYTYNPTYITQFQNYLNTLPVQELRTILYNLLLNPDISPAKIGPISRYYQKNNRDDRFSSRYVINTILTTLLNKSGSLLDTGNDNVYIVGTYDSNKQTGWVWNRLNNVVLELSVHDIPYWQNKIVNEWSDYVQAGNFDTYVDPYISQHYSGLFRSFAKGGVIKALNGISSDLVDWTDEDLADGKRLRNLYNTETGKFDLQSRSDSKATDKIAPGNKRYDPEPGGKELEDLEYYKLWSTYLRSNEKLAEAWARRYRDLSASDMPHANSWFNADGSFNYENFKNSNVFSDKINGIGHDIYRGRTYKFDNRYYKNIPEGYELDSSDPTLDANGLVYIYNLKLTGNTDNQTNTSLDGEQPDTKTSGSGNSINEGDGNGGGSSVSYDTLEKLLSNRTKPNKFLSTLNNIAPDILGASRLAGSLYNNNNIYKTVRKSLRPALQDTYELYSPVTGAYSEMLLANRLGNDLSFMAGIPISSDARLQAARQMEAESRRKDIEYKGKLADDKAINTSLIQALGRVENNVARRSDVANKNRASLIAYSQNLALLDAAWKKLSWDAIDNYLLGIEQNQKLRRQEKEDTRKNYINLVAEQMDLEDYKQVQNELETALETWRNEDIKNRQNVIPIWYKNAYRNVGQWYANKRLRTVGNLLNIDLNGYELPELPRPNPSSYVYKQGGKLNINLLISKIIREHEYNS